jgi:hypothetical protein
MNGYISLLLFSSLFICIITIYLAKAGPDLDVIDIYIIFVLLHFGLYPFVKGLSFSKDVIFDFHHSNPLVIGLIFAHVLLILAIIRVVSWYIPSKLANYLKIRNLIEQWSHINKYVLLSIYAALILFQIISYYKYGVITYIMPEDFARIGKHLPYWFTSIRTIYPLFSFLIFLGLFSNILKSKGYYQYVWIILTILFVPIATIYGRRFFLAMIVASAIFWIAEKREKIFQLKYLKVGVVVVCGFLLFSNLFQAYRQTFQTVGQVNLEKLKNPFAAAINFKATLKNLTLRPGTWEFNFLVFNKQFSKPDMTTNGKITWEGFKSSIPRFFWHGKKFTCIDDILADLYHVKPKEIDIGKNLFGVVQVDFGYLSLIIVPTIILSLVVIMGILINITGQYPTVLWLFSGNILFFLVNIEENGNEIFFMIRYIFFILILFGAYLLAHKLYLVLMNYIALESGKVS